MTNHKTFEHRSIIHTTPAEMVAFHADPAALRKLTMPPTAIQVLRDDRSSLTEGEIEFRLWLGPLPVRWLARHAPGPTATSFTDQMVRGPMAFWEHAHIFEVVEDGVTLIDRITFAHKPGWRGLLTRLMFDGLPLRILFLYRHWRTERALT
ncbi:MAG: cyclase [Chloroflexi bacterium]|nr:cyclase [Chloroflexota bacterium]